MGDSYERTCLEAEESLDRIKRHEGVSGIVIMNREQQAIRATFSDTTHYCQLVDSLVWQAREVIRDLNPQDDLKFLRVGTKKHELLISSEENYIIAVTQDAQKEA